MELAFAFGTVIVLVLGMLAGAIYVGGGSTALRRQSGIIALMAVSLAAIGFVMFLVTQTQAGLSLVGFAVPIAAAIIAALQARSITAHHSGARPPPLAIAMWLIAAFFVVLATAGAVMLLA